jgi:uncharacterized membrane protein YedE/YeeE
LDADVKAAISNLVLGLVFGLGLILSGMANPAKVLNFLDVAGSWDPSLAFVMAGAIAVTATGYALVLRRSRPLLQTAFDLPATTPIDRTLVAGAAVFGLGWGLSGYCPGPALVALPLGAPATLAFGFALIVSIAAAAAVLRRR